MQNAKHEKTTTTLITLMLVMSAGLIATQYVIAESAHASHGTLKTFQTGDLQYICHDNLSDLDYEKIVPCTEFGKAATTWSDAISSLNITDANLPAEITVYSGTFMMDNISAKMTPLATDTDLKHALIKFSTKHKWGDGTDWLHILFGRYDFQTIALHELGHALGLDHDNSSPLMKNGLNVGEVQRTVPAHDKNAVQERFGDL